MINLIYNDMVFNRLNFGLPQQRSVLLEVFLRAVQGVLIFLYRR